MMIEKIHPWRSPAYLAWVRDRPCAHCGNPGPSEAHHVIGISGGFLGGKTGDNLAVPLCTHCHRELHQDHLSLDAQANWLIRTQARAFHEGVLGLTG